ncbi:MAG: HAD family hydrolase [Planctomycetia bacterium]|nr:HAD family hydrolase [Planctomycetia bacterium]
MKRPAVFVDRDGTINEDVGYLARPSQLRLIAGAAEAIARLNQHGVPVVVVTNQAGVARGLFAESAIGNVHARLDKLLARHGACVDRYDYCPHHPRDGQGAYQIDCECRKPRPGMLLRVAEELGLDLARSYMIGDKLTDLEAGAHAGCRTILVRSGYGAQAATTLAPGAYNVAGVFDSLLPAIEFCLPRLTGQRQAPPPWHAVRAMPGVSPAPRQSPRRRGG